MSHLSFVDNESFDISKIHFEKLSSGRGIECHRVLFDGKPMIYQTPAFYLFDHIQTDKRTPSKSLSMVSINDETDDFLDNTTSIENLVMDLKETFLTFKPKRESITMKTFDEMYGIYKNYERETTYTTLSFGSNRDCSIKCDLIDHHSSSETELTDHNMHKLVPKYSSIKCDLKPVVYYNSKYFGLSWKIVGISVVSFDPKFSDMWIRSETEELPADSVDPPADSVDPPADSVDPPADSVFSKK